MRFLIEAEPRRGEATEVSPGVRRIVADNPGPMTNHGTNTYLVSAEEGPVIVDPGPDDVRHVEAILGATGGRVSCILLTHTHKDHVGAAPALQIATGAPIAGFVYPATPGLPIQIGLRNGDSRSGLTAIHTPGHASDHLCYARDSIVFSGDHVMSWSSSVVNPPDGNMAAYFRSLERLLLRDDRLYLPGHGPPLPDPQDFVRDLLRHRQGREAAIVAALAQGPLEIAELVERTYGPLDPLVRSAAERNVAAHLEKLGDDGAAVQRSDGRWQARAAGDSD